MKQIILKKIDPKSIAKAISILYLLMSLIWIVPVFIIGIILEGGIKDTSQIIFLFTPFIFWIISFILVYLFSLILNFVLSKTGGIKLYFNSENLTS